MTTLKHYNNLTPAELERLAILGEEMGEVLQAIGKILRHGYESFYLNGPTNRAQLETEIGDVLSAIRMMKLAGDLDKDKIKIAKRNKSIKILNFTHHQPDPFTHHQTLMSHEVVDDDGTNWSGPK